MFTGVLKNMTILIYHPTTNHDNSERVYPITWKIGLPDGDSEHVKVVLTKSFHITAVEIWAQTTRCLILWVTPCTTVGIS